MARQAGEHIQDNTQVQVISLGSFHARGTHLVHSIETGRVQIAANIY